MNTQDIDKAIKKAIDESTGFYDRQAGEARERIWRQIQTKNHIPSRLFIIRSLAAACILLFIFSSILFISHINMKKSMSRIAELNTVLNNTISDDQKVLNREETSELAKINPPDTVYLVKKVKTSEPVVLTRQITDTVYIKQIVYVEKEPTDEILKVNESDIASQTINESDMNYIKEIIIRENETNKAGKGRKLQIRFGGNIDQANNGTLAISTNL